MNALSRMIVRSTRALCWALALAASAAHAQPGTPTGLPPVVNQGAAYYVFTEPGAPNIQVLLTQTGQRAGIYLVAEETTLTDFVALAGISPPQSTVVREPTRVSTQTTTIRVFRENGGTRTAIYEADPDQFIREPGRHPVLETGDIVQIEVVSDSRVVPKRFTLLDGLDIAARIASFASLILLVTRSGN